MDYNKLINIHNNMITRVLEFYNDLITINYKPIRNGQSTSFDSFFNEAVDSTNPSNIGVTETIPPPVTITGKFHTDLYASKVSNSNADEQLNIGVFEQSDALFTCLYDYAVKDTSTGETVFDNVDYIESSKDKSRYEVISVKKRGFKDVFLIDVFLKRTNK